MKKSAMLVLIQNLEARVRALESKGFVVSGPRYSLIESSQDGQDEIAKGEDWRGLMRKPGFGFDYFIVDNTNGQIVWRASAEAQFLTHKAGNQC